jgi:cyclic pyranopterin phosphate synthase
MKDDLTHFNKDGEAHMVDVAHKKNTHRIAVARGHIIMQKNTLDLVRTGGHKKGDVLGLARTAGIMACKKTPDLIPLCHPLNISKVEISFKLEDSPPCIYCHAHIETTGQTGVEIEALTAVQIALLTIYDMCKSVDRGMTMSNIELVSKSGGQSGNWERE